MSALARAVLAVAFVAAAATTTAPALRAAPDDGVAGVWLTENGDARIEIAACGDAVCGRIVWVEEPLDDEGKEKLDKHNPDESLRSRPIVGLPLLIGFKPDGPGKWEDGRIYSPRDGELYKCTMRLDGPDTLRVRGYIGIPLLGQTEVWTRVK
jgi:uncharacterized protein (DUF2147 family)